MNAASLLKFFIDKKIIKIKENELLKLTSQIGSDVILGKSLIILVLISYRKDKKILQKNKYFIHLL